MGDLYHNRMYDPNGINVHPWDIQGHLRNARSPLFIYKRFGFAGVSGNS